jgi:hypothetical protein
LAANKKRTTVACISEYRLVKEALNDDYCFCRTQPSGTQFAVDDIGINAVPEPASLILLLVRMKGNERLSPKKRGRRLHSNRLNTRRLFSIELPLIGREHFILLTHCSEAA